MHAVASPNRTTSKAPGANSNDGLANASLETGKFKPHANEQIKTAPNQGILSEKEKGGDEDDESEGEFSTNGRVDKVGFTLLRACKGGRGKDVVTWEGLSN